MSIAIPADNFRHYVEGGRLWPQKRCATNVFFLYPVLSDVSFPVFGPSLLDTLRSDPSENQLAILDSVTNRLHTSAGIPVTVTAEQLRQEWRATKSYAIRTLIFYCSDSNLHVYQQGSGIFAPDIFDPLVSDILNNLSEDQCQRFKACVVSAYNVIKRERRLSGLYRLTFFSRPAIDILRPAPNFAVLTSNLDLDDFLARKELYRRSILIRVGLLIHREIRDSSPFQSTGWLTTGFFAE